MPGLGRKQTVATKQNKLQDEEETKDKIRFDIFADESEPGFNKYKSSQPLLDNVSKNKFIYF